MLASLGHGMGQSDIHCLDPRSYAKCRWDGQERQKGAGKTARRRRGRLTWHAFARLTFLGLLLLSSVQAQQNSDENEADDNVDSRPSRPSSSSSVPASTSTSGPVVSTQTPIAMVESQVIQTTLDIGSAAPARFYLEAPFKNGTYPLYVTASLCSGPAIPSYDVNNSTVLKELDLDYFDAMTSTLLTMYVSTDQVNKSPGPESLEGQPDIAYFYGGLAIDVNQARQPDGAWISVHPPKDVRNTTGTYSFFIGASSEGPLVNMQRSQGVSFADSDRNNALLSTYNASQGLSPNLTLAILPTEGVGSLRDSYYFNSSICAIAAAYTSFNSARNPARLTYNRTETMRGSMYANTTRVQWAVSDLTPNTNYTAWLFDVGKVSANSTTFSTTMWSAIKFVTKRADNCRLVWDIPFCPSVAYAIPVGANVPTERALSVIAETVNPNFANFSATLDTFPCGSTSFGQYSPLKTCDNCRSAYQDWLCAVAMPRCTDPLPSISNETSAAVPDPYQLFGTETPVNSLLLPYTVNRYNDSRQAYVDDPDGLNAGLYGETLPCIYTCYAVASSCPQPLTQWYCPIWDITAQAQYGTFADAGQGGLGGGQNGGAGSDGQRWGGPARYIAQDAFGNVYCNAMNTERSLLVLNAAVINQAPSIFTLTLVTLISVLATIFGV